ncbi:hypothetical protein I316_03534 [Kwoniella heveanensis BCC8398]|uniref:Peptidase A1 domain-containing protein n=1 Tax=Kwoniella heveanensis BCC8398 TaxID=1296120 RepID=A0A1B9GVC4_9TREE|nr:hypothetical protein I316_03534 [Kwoniella heveanensis BCC8398]
MHPLHFDDQPVAGPSSRPYVAYSPRPINTLAPTRTLNTPSTFLTDDSSTIPTPTSTVHHRGSRVTAPALRPSKLEQAAWYARNHRRQDNSNQRQSNGEGAGAGGSSSSSSIALAETTALQTGFSETGAASSSSSSSYLPLFTGPSGTSSSSEPYPYGTASPNPSGSGSNITDVDTYTETSTSASSSSYYRSTTFTSLWSYSASRSRTASASTPTQSVYVPGVVLNMTLGGDSDTEAVYSVEVDFGHQSPASYASWDWRRRRGLRRRGSSSSSWNGVDIQKVNLQVDLGSSDMWVAISDCKSTSCQSAPKLYNISQSLESGVSADITYQSGAVSGDIYWEEIGVGDFGIGFQAFIAATSVTDEDLKGGNFDGVLGLALPASSTILQTIGGTTGSNPDGATFLDNLFGAGADAPTERLFALSLERREDVRTMSTFSIGTVHQSYCPSPCQPPYIPIISQPQLGTTGYLHWRIPLQSVSVTTWDDQEHGTGATVTNITLGASQVYPSRSTPLAVLDSGGVQILTGRRQYADSIYSALGISMSADGFYRMPCKQQVAITFNIAGQVVPVHPLDMTYTDPEDASQTTCIGMIQYSSNLGDSGDFILGSSFLKNVYSIYQYPDTNKQKTWQPTIGLIPLTNASIASQDFYAVRVQRQSLSSVSSDQQAENGGSPTYNPGAQTSSGADGKKVVNTAVIAAVSVVGFFVLAAAAFCAWWFWLRRKFGAAGVVEYKSAPKRPGTGAMSGHRSDSSLSSLRNKKHGATQRQRSMVEGYSDYEGDSWMSTTEGNDSIRLGYLPEVAEEDEGRQTRVGDRRSSRGSTLPGDKTGEAGYELVDMNDPMSPTRVRTRSPPPLAPPIVPGKPTHAHTNSEVELPNSANSETFPLAASGPYPYPSSRSLSMSMSGPFPSPGASRMSGPFPSPGGGPNRHSIRPDASPMYDIRTSDYFSVPPAATTHGRGREGRRSSNSTGTGTGGGLGLDGTGRRESSSGPASRRRSSPSKGAGIAEPTVVEE